MKQVVHSRPRTLQGESVAEQGTLLQIIIILVCECDIEELHGNLSHPFKKVVERNIWGRQINAETIFHTLIISH